MAVMASQTAQDAMPFDQKPHAVDPPGSNPPDNEVNGNLNHHDQASDLPATSESLTNGDRPHPVELSTEEHTEKITVQVMAPAPELQGSSAQMLPMEVTGTEPGASFAQLPPDAMITDPAEPAPTSTVPPPVEQPTSDLRDTVIPAIEPPPEPAAEPALDRAPEAAPEMAPEVSTEPAVAPAPEVAPDLAEQVDAQADREMAEAAETKPATADNDAMDISTLEETRETAEGDLALRPGAEILNEPQEPTKSENIVPGAPQPSAEDAEMVTQPLDPVSSGQVHPRDEDDDAEPAAKRAKTDEEPSSSDQPAEFKMPSVPATVADAAAPITENGSTVPAASGLAGLPPTPDFDSEALSAPQKKFILDAVRRSKKIKAATPFMQPVDHVAMRIPTYPEIIKNPMDLSTIEERMKADQYSSANAVAADIDLIVQNAITFNGAQHPVAQAGMNVRAHFIKIMASLPKGGTAAAAEKKKKKPAPAPKPLPVRRESRAATAKSPTTKAPEPHQPFIGPDGTPLIRRASSTNNRPKREIHPPKSRDLPYSVRPKKKKAVAELKFCENVLDEIMKKKHATLTSPFLRPVDPVAMKIPTYFSVVKEPMDLSTIRSNLRSGEISSAKDFHAAFELMLENCFKFNPVGNPFYKIGKQLQELFEKLWADKNRYLAEQMPRSEPESPEPESDAEGEDEDESAAAQMKRMLEIQQQIAALSQEAMMLSSSAQMPAQHDQRKSPKAAGKKAAKAGKAALTAKVKRTNSAGAPAAAKATTTTTTKKKKTFRRLSLDQKRYVSEAIAQLNESEMNKAVQIIRNGVPRLRDVHDDELELDIEEIPDDVVFTLYEFVRKLHPQENDADDDDYEEAAASSSKPAAAAGRKKNKPMSAREQESKIAQVQRKLQQFTGSGSEEVLEAQRAEESSDDAQSESSEEE